MPGFWDTDFGSYLQSAGTQAARGLRAVREATDPFQYAPAAAQLAAGMLPGAGFVQGAEDARAAREAWQAGDYARALGSALSSVGNTGLEALGPAGHAAMAIPPLARLKNGNVAAGVVFRDVDMGHLQFPRAVNREINRRIDRQDWSEADVPIRRLYATQPIVNSDYAKVLEDTLQDGYHLPLVVRDQDGVMRIYDGHHRLTAQADKDQQTARVRLIDLLQQADNSGPLLFDK